VSEWAETYGGVVTPWECDLVQRFIIAYYFERFVDARLNLLEAVISIVCPPRAPAIPPVLASLSASPMEMGFHPLASRSVA
jgi:hypothetical protein